MVNLTNEFDGDGDIALDSILIQKAKRKLTDEQIDRYQKKAKY